MGLGDFIFLIDKLGWVGIILTLFFIVIMTIGSIVDIYQFISFARRVKRMKRKKVL